MPSRAVLTHFTKVSWHGTAFFGSVNESEPKWAVLALKNLHLGTSSIVFCPESNVSKLERYEDIQACGNLMGNVRLMAESFVYAWFFLSSVMDYGGQNRNRAASHAFAALAVSSEKSCTATVNARKSSKKSYRQSRRTRHSLIKLDRSITRPRTPTGTPTF